jgi:hypothetical protein
MRQEAPISKITVRYHEFIYIGVANSMSKFNNIFNNNNSSAHRNTSSISRIRPMLNYQVKENHIKGVYVENLSERRATSVEEAYIMFLYGLYKRKMYATVKNQESSRSHSVF